MPSETTRLEDRLRALSSHLRAVREEERRRIAREIHDDLGQALTALKINLDWIGRHVVAEDPEAPVLKKVRSMADLLNQALQKVRQLECELRPAILDDLGLAPALEWQAEEYQRQTGLSCQLQIDHEITLSPGSSIEVFRAFQEILGNIVVQASATRVGITWEQQDGHVVLSVRDNGTRVLDLSAADSHPLSAMWLTSIRERMRPLGGEVAVRTVPQEGTTVVVRLPCDADRAGVLDRGPQESA